MVGEFIRRQLPGTAAPPRKMRRLLRSQSRLPNQARRTASRRSRPAHGPARSLRDPRRTGFDSIVPLPIRSGSSVENGTSGSCAVPAASACRISLRPGAIAPPRKIRSASTTSSVIAVPQSTAIAGSGWNAASAIALATRSAPSVDVSTCVKSTRQPQWRESIKRISAPARRCFSSGTTVAGDDRHPGGQGCRCQSHGFDARQKFERASVP